MGDLLKKYRAYRSTTLLDCAAAASGLTVDQVTAQHADPLVSKAIAATNPTFDPNATYSDEELLGITNTAKGKYFEYLVAEKLNSGQSVGDVVLPDNYHVQLADSMVQPGWDMKILDPDGQESAYLQLKATDSASYIHHALERYPDIKIMATSEVATSMDGDHMILNTGISENDLLHSVQVGVGDGSGFLTHFWDAFHPIVPLLLIAGMNGYQVLVGKRSVRDSVEIAQARAHRAVVAAGTGALVKALGGGWLSIPAALLAGYWVTEGQHIDELIAALRKQTHKLSLMIEYYNLAVKATT